MSSDELLDIYEKLWDIENYSGQYPEEVAIREYESISSELYDDTEIMSYKNIRNNAPFSRRDLRNIICDRYNQEIAESDVDGAANYRVVFSDGGTLDQVRLIHDEQELSKNVQSYILNLAAPSTLYELEMILTSDMPRLDIEEVIGCTGGSWTAPRWAKAGDIIFYSHGKRAIAKITSTKTELKNSKDYYDEDEYKELDQVIEKERILHSKYGGTIFAVGQLCGAPESFDCDQIADGLHYKTRIFAEIDNMCVFQNPVKVDDCKDFLHISMTSGITPVDGDIFDSLKNKLKEENDIPLFLEKATATPIPLSRINDENWMTLSNDFRRSFIYEAQFRHYYVDRLLKALSGRKTIFRECRCKKSGIGNSFIDNVIKFENRFLPVEVKLSIFVEKNIKKQVRKYCYDDFIVLDQTNGRTIYQDEVYNDKVLIVDTFAVYMYDYDSDSITELLSLDDLVDNETVNLLHDRVKKCLA